MVVSVDWSMVETVFSFGCAEAAREKETMKTELIVVWVIEHAVLMLT